MISGTAPSLSIACSKSCHETRNVDLVFVILASAKRRTPMSLHRQHSLSVYFSRIPMFDAFAATRELHGSPLPSHTDALEVNFSCDNMAVSEPFCKSLRLKVFNRDIPTTIEAEEVAEV